MEELSTDVYVFPLPARGGGLIRPAGVATETGIILLDTGYDDQADALGDHLEEAGYGYGDVEVVVLTHQDGDHAGCAAEVRDRSGALVAAHAADVPFIDGREDPIKSGPDRYPPVPVDIELTDGVRFRTNAGPMTTIHTPGHTPGHLVLHLPDQGLLVAADALSSEEHLGGPNELYTPDMDSAIESAHRLTNLAFDRTLTYHGGYIEEGASELRDHLA